MYYVYVLKSLKDDKLYIGLTSNLKKRFDEHNAGSAKSTKHRRPFRLIYTESFTTRSEAFKKEQKLKLPSAGRFKKKLLKQ